MTIDSTGRRCKCGNYGCLEAYASGPAIAARAVEGVEAGADTSLPGLRRRATSRKITAQVVYEAAHDGDEYAREVVHDTAKLLGAGVANIINIFNPQVVVICGGVTLAGRPAVRAAAQRGEAARVQAGGERLPHRAGRADGHGRRVRRRGGVHAPDVGNSA